MIEGSDWRLLIPKDVRDLPADLAFVVAVTVGTILAVFVPVLNETPVRIVLGLGFVLFVPGYAFIAALFPEAGRSPDADMNPDEDPEPQEDVTQGSGIDGIERVALSFASSIAGVPLIGLVLNFTPFGIRLAPIVASLSAFILGSVVVAANRRRALPEPERFSVPYRSWAGSMRSELLQPDTRGDAVLNVLLVASIVLATASVGYAVAVPKEGEQFSEFYVLTENETGALVADDYPTNYTVGEPKPVTVGIGNNEREQTQYTVVMELQRVDLVDNETNVSVLEATELQRYTTTAPKNGTTMRNMSIRPPFEGENLRLVFLLYKGEAPTEPTTANAYRELHLWVNVTTDNVTNATTTRPASAMGPEPVRA
jgi:uncharacterized membrane protein